MNTPDDLDFIATEILLENLGKRFDSFLFIAHSNTTVEEDAITFDMRGSFPTCYGLAQIALDHMCRESVPEEEDD